MTSPNVMIVKLFVLWLPDYFIGIWVGGWGGGGLQDGMAGGKTATWRLDIKLISFFVTIVSFSVNWVIILHYNVEFIYDNSFHTSHTIAVRECKHDLPVRSLLATLTCVFSAWRERFFSRRSVSRDLVFCSLLCCSPRELENSIDLSALERS